MIEHRTGRALVLGAGASGIAAARLLTAKGWRVAVIDRNPALADQLRGVGFAPETVDARSDTSSIVPGSVDFAVVSPGIPRRHPWLADLQSKHVAVLPEFELGVHFMPGVKVVAVTGSNGKSSLVKWIADTLTLAGTSAVPAGNYGLPPCDLAFRGENPRVLVLELSSFQLEQSVRFRPDIGVLLNLTPNHLDRHADVEEYARAKARLFDFIRPGDHAIVHAPAWRIVQSMLPAGVNPILFDEGPACECGHEEGRIRIPGNRALDVSGTWWGGQPQAVNAVAGAVVLDLLGVPLAAMRAAAEQFAPLPHRQEEFAEHRGVVFVDDSKASTLSALQASVAAGRQKKHLIAGGILKESDVGFVKEILAENCAFVYCIGIAGEKMVESWNEVVPCEYCGDLATAVNAVFARMKSGERVLLSPGCSSFDQFTSYAQRGQKFKELVRQRIQQDLNNRVTTQGVGT